MGNKIRKAVENFILEKYTNNLEKRGLHETLASSTEFRGAYNAIVRFTNLYKYETERLLDIFIEDSNPSVLKPANEFTEYQHPERTASRNQENDRVHPLETVRIQEFRTEHNRDIEEVFLHSGSFADEMARSYNALAITIANHIYFRSNAYNPHTEEGQQLLAHELTHVAQHKEGAITKNTTTKELEQDAENAEKKAAYEVDPIVTIEVNGHRYSFRKSKMNMYARKIAGTMKEWMLEQKMVMRDEEYLKLLCAYEKWVRV